MRTLAVFRRVLRGFKRDKRTLALVMMAPVLVLTLVWFIFHGDEYRPKVAAVDLHPDLVEAMEKREARVQEVDQETADRMLEANEVDAVIREEDGRLIIHMEGSDPTASGSVRALVFGVMRDRAGEVKKKMGDEPPPFMHIPEDVKILMQPPEWEYLHGSQDMSTFDNFGPVLLGFLVFFFTFIVSGVSFVRERSTGTLDRMLASPIRSWELVAGYAMAFAVVVLAQATVVCLVSVYLLDMMLVGSLGWLLVITLMLALTAMTLGMFLSAFARSEFQLFQFIPLVIIPQIFFSGIFSMDTMAPWLRAIGKGLPLTYGARAMRQVMIRGAGFSDIALDLLVLAGFALAFMALNVVVLKRMRAV